MLPMHEPGWADQPDRARRFHRVVAGNVVAGNVVAGNVVAGNTGCP
jgi:hypothetical protein